MDRDSHDSYNVEILAIDSGNPRNTATTSIVVNIQDVNDKLPVFNESSFSTLYLKEGSTILPQGLKIKVYTFFYKHH